jgi:hypothetical protein
MPLGWRSETRQTAACKESAQNERLCFHATNVVDVAIRDGSLGCDEDYLAPQPPTPRGEPQGTTDRCARLDTSRSSRPLSPHSSNGETNSRKKRVRSRCRHRFRVTRRPTLESKGGCPPPSGPKPAGSDHPLEETRTSRTPSRGHECPRNAISWPERSATATSAPCATLDPNLPAAHTGDR